MKTIINFIKKNKFESFLVVILVALALFLRLYRISEFMTFLGDEGRDLRIVRDLITHGNLVFIGPMTSVGNMYLGPLYYYMMAPALFLSGLNPVGPAVMVALLGVLTVWLVWFIGRHWFGRTAGFLAALFFAISPVAIIYSRSSWNPNPMPFFALISIWGIYQVWREKKYFWLPIVGLSVAAALQMHYLGLLLLPALGIFWLFSLLAIKDNPGQRKIFLKMTVISGILFLVLMSPLALFDLKHNGMNFKAFQSFFSDRQTTVNLNPVRSDRFIPIINMTSSDLLLARQEAFSPLASLVLVLLSLVVFFKAKQKSALKLLFSWLGFAWVGLSVYKQHVYIHYLGFIYPAIFLLMGVILSFLLQKKIIFQVIGTLLVSYLVYLNLANSPAFGSPNRQLQRTEQAVDLIIQESKGLPFNFGLIAKQNYDESYRYVLENKKASLVKEEDKIVDQLFVICEDGDSCKPEGNPQWQVAVFGQAHIIGEWQIDYLKIYRLVHTK